MIVVTGGAGFIGSNVVAALEARGEGPILVSDRINDEVEIPRFAGPFPTTPQITDFRSEKDGKEYISIVMPVTSRPELGSDELFPEFEDVDEEATGEEELIGYVCLGLNQERMQRESREFLISTTNKTRIRRDVARSSARRGCRLSATAGRRTACGLGELAVQAT